MYRDYANHCFETLRDEMLSAAALPVELFLFAGRAEELLYEIDPAGMYTCSYLYHRLGAVETAEAAAERLSGEAVQHDLRRMIEDLTDAAEMSAADAGEPVHTVDELAKMFAVSTKTISRWRTHGLVARKFLFEGRKRIGFLRSSVQRFYDRNRSLVERARRFRQLSSTQRRAIVSEARELARRGQTPAEVFRRLARSFDKSLETVRQTLRRHDREHPGEVLFPSSGADTSWRERARQRYQQGESIASLARRFHKSEPTIRRTIARERAAWIGALNLDFIPSAEFEQADAAERLLAPLPTSDKAQRRVRAPKGLSPYLAALYETPLLTREQEYHLFRQYNYLKYRASQRRRHLDPRRPQGRLLDEIEELVARAESLKQRLVQANMRLVVSIAKRYTSPTQELAELVSDGNISLMRAVEKFDYSRGFKFSTYATWAIVKNFARTLAVENKQHTRFKTGQDEVLDAERDQRDNELALLSDQDRRSRQVNRIMRYLNDREQQIVTARFGLLAPFRCETLKEIGDHLGVTKERVRQLEQRAMQKLREAAREEAIRLDDVL